MEDAERNRQLKVFQPFFGFIGMTPIGFFSVVILAFLPMIPPFNQEYLVRWLIVGLFMAAQAVAFSFTSAYINIVNFGFAAFVGLGAYTSAILTVRLEMNPWIGIFLGSVPAAVLGLLTGLLTLRLRGIFAAIMTWFISLALYGVVIKMVFLTEGSLGLKCPVLFRTSSNVPYFYIIFIMFAICYIVLKKLVQSRMGLAFRAIGQNMEAARTSGINPNRYRVINFTISCGFAGWLGAFYAHYYGILMPEVMLTNRTIEVLIVVYIGGRASLWGGAFIAIPFLFATEMIRSAFSSYPGVNLIFYGLFLILTMIFYPGGIAHLYQALLARCRNPFILRMAGMDRIFTKGEC